MNERIKVLLDKTLAGEMHPNKNETAYDKEDLFLSPVKMSGKRVAEYILNQEPIILPESKFTGCFRFDNSVEGDIFRRNGHKNFKLACEQFYKQPLRNLATLEWQHSTGDHSKTIRVGMKGLKAEIAASMVTHVGDKDAVEFLEALDGVCDAMVGLAHKCAARALSVAEETENTDYRANLTRLAQTLNKVPEYPADSFYEAVACLYICFSLVPDSIGLIDRYLYPYYRHDIDAGILTRETAKEYLQELFLMLQAWTPKGSHFTRGGESHFAIGGYLADGSDGFNDLSRLIVESLMELPTYIPQVTLRWTQKTSKEVFRYMMDCERKDKNKRIAFVNDEPKIKAFTEHLGMAFEDAVNYTMVGCNEVAFPGGIYMGSAQENICRFVARVFHECEEIKGASTFEEFYRIFERELFADLDEMLELEDKFNLLRARDVNIVSSLLFAGCIERAKSVTQGGARLCSAGIDIIGVTNVIDSIAVVKQFVYDEKSVSMSELVAALKNNWQGYEELRMLIKKRGKFFGNDDETSNFAAQRFSASLYDYLKDKTSMFGCKYLAGNLIGYIEHHKIFGALTPATPDGRADGDLLKFGLGQSGGYDREGLTALLSSVAKCDPCHIFNGPTVTNVTLDEKLMTNDQNFEKTVNMFEAFFQNGGIHFQLTYVSREELMAAQQTPEDYKNLRVRVSGFSDYFVNLNRALQDDVIARTTHE